jgi:hypothetical protein
MLPFFEIRFKTRPIFVSFSSCSVGIAIIARSGKAILISDSNSKTGKKTVEISSFRSFLKVLD